MKKLVEVVNVRTGQRTPAPRFCPTCGRELADGECRHVMGTSFEVFCSCGVPAVVIQNDMVALT